MESQIPPGAVVVGVDGSDDADRAVRWAAGQADREGRTLALVHAVGPAVLPPAPLVGMAPFDHTAYAAALRDSGLATLAAARSLAASVAPDPAVVTVLLDDDPRAALTEATSGAHLVVVGSRGRGPLRTALLGSVSTAVARHASVPVVVCRPRRSAPTARVVVGADGTAGSRPALEFAFRQASLWGAPLTVMHCFWDVLVATRGTGRVEPGLPDDPTELRLLLAEAVAGMQEKFPDVEVRTELARGLVDDCLADRSPDSGLLVVGRPAASWSRFLHASCAIAVLERARTAVAVVPETSTEETLR